MISLGCCSFVLDKPLEDSLRLIANVGFRQVDVSAAHAGAQAQIDQEEAVLQPDRQAAATRELLARYGLEPEELFVTRVRVDGQRLHINHPDTERRARMLPRFERLCAFGTQAGFKSIMGVPGIVQETLGAEGSWTVAAEMLSAMLRIAQTQGIRFNVEPHAGSILEMPGSALKMASDVPGLTYTLDYSHFVMHGIPEGEVAPLHAHTTHMHARQARLDHLYATMAEGTTNFPFIIKALKDAGWDGVIAMEGVAGETGRLCDNSVIQNVLLACQIDDLVRSTV